MSFSSPRRWADKQYESFHFVIFGFLCMCVMRSFKQKAEAVTLQRSITLQPGEESEFTSTKEHPRKRPGPRSISAWFCFILVSPSPKHRCFVIVCNLTYWGSHILVGTMLFNLLVTHKGKYTYNTYSFCMTFQCSGCTIAHQLEGHSWTCFVLKTLEDLMFKNF